MLILLTAACGSTRVGENEYNKGIEAFKADKIELAQQLFEKSIQKNPKLAEAYINLGMVYIKQHKTEKAWQTTQTGLDVINQTRDTIIRGGSWQEQAALANNNLAKIVFDKAITAYNKKDISTSKKLQNEALSYLSKAIKLAPEDELIKKNITYIQQWPN